MKHVEVGAAVIIYNGKVLCMQRKDSKLDYISRKFEFPGGKLEIGETAEQALTRELKEEMEIDVVVDKKDFFMTVNHLYPDFSITMHSYILNVKNCNFVMNEHLSYRWLHKEELLSLDWAAADLPIVRKLMENS